MMEKKHLLPFAFFPIALITVGGWQFANSDRFAGHEYGRYVASLPVATVLLTLMSILLWFLAAAYLSRLGRKALMSREDLYTAFSRGKKVLPLIVLSAFLAMLLSLLCIGAYEVIDYKFIGRLPEWRGKVAGLILTLGIMMWYGLFKQARRTCRALSVTQPFVLRAMPVSENDAPKLFALIKAVARKGDFILPDTVLAGFDDGFFVFEDAVQLENGERIPFGKVLHLYIPLMTYFDEGEFRAVIGHELAHLTHKDTDYQRKFSKEFRQTHIAFSTLADVDADQGSVLEIMTRPFVSLAYEFLHTFDIADKQWSREREFAADKASANVCSGENCSVALLRTAAFSPAVDEVLSAYYSCATPPEESILIPLTRITREKAKMDLKTLLEWEQPHPSDTHPTLMERMKQFGISPDVPVIEKALTVTPGKLLRDLGIL